ncbi:MAG: hypothetical protein GX754_05235 [Clostridiaceae bacterium]|nr:hypothetical protein [Clostridiaceae bacterium]
MKKCKAVTCRYNHVSSLVYLAFLTAVLLAIACMPSSTYANGASLGGLGETVRPIDNPDIIMQSENITVRVSESVSKVECEFVFENLKPVIELEEQGKYAELVEYVNKNMYAITEEKEHGTGSMHDSTLDSMLSS